MRKFVKGRHGWHAVCEVGSWCYFIKPDRAVNRRRALKMLGGFYEYAKYARPELFEEEVEMNHE